MPRMDGTGPMGQGATNMTAGPCFGRRANTAHRGYGLGRGMGLCRNQATDTRELLTARQSMLKAQLAAVEEELNQL